MLLQLGEAPESFPSELGGYLRWFENALDGPLELVDGRPESGRTPLPDPSAYAGVIVSEVHEDVSCGRWKRPALRIACALRARRHQGWLNSLVRA